MSTAEVYQAVGSLVVLILLALSVRIWSDLWKRFRAGQPPLPMKFPGTTVRAPRFALCLTVLYLLLNFAPQPAPPEEPPPAKTEEQELRHAERMLAATLMVSLIILPVLLGAVVLEVRSTTGLQLLGFRSDDLTEQISTGVKGFLAAILPVALLLLISFPLRSEEAIHPFLKLLHRESSGLNILMIFLTAGILAPLTEELMFRVILQTQLLEIFTPKVAITLCALIFSAVHGLPDSIPLMGLSLVLGTVYYYQRSYLTIVLIHAIFNFSNLIGMFIPDAPPLQEEFSLPPSP